MKQVEKITRTVDGRLSSDKAKRERTPIIISVSIAHEAIIYNIIKIVRPLIGFSQKKKKKKWYNTNIKRNIKIRLGQKIFKSFIFTYIACIHFFFFIYIFN